MKKIYIKPSIAVEQSVLPAIMDTLSADSMKFGGGTSGTGDGEAPIEVQSKYMYYDGFGSFDTFDEDDY